MEKDPSQRGASGLDPDRQQTTPSEHLSRRAPAKIQTGAVALLKEFYKRFMEDDVLTLSGALAFTGVLSLIPIMLFAVLATGFVFRDPVVANQYVLRFVERLLPGESASRAAHDVLNQTQLVGTAQEMSHHVGWPLLIGVVSLLWAGISLISTAADVMNSAWDVKETRNPLRVWAIALGVLFGAGGIFVLSLLTTGLPAFLSGGLWGPVGAGLAWGMGILAPLIAIVLDTAMFVLIYKVLPNTQVSWRAALFAGSVTGLLWEAFKQGFAFYLTHFGSSGNKIYGALGGIVLLITWIYYSCVLLLAGAEIGKMYHEHSEGGGVSRRSND